eukprot:2537070-Rhodomonas_salina.3
MAAAVEKVLLFNGKPEWWMVQLCKFGAVFTQVGHNWVQKLAEMNLEEVQQAGSVELDAWLAADDARDAATAQEYVYSTLVLAIVDALPDIVGRIDENEAECGTQLWNELLRKFQPNERPARARHIMQITNRCTTFDGQNEDWSAHIAAVESDLAVLQSLANEFTIEEVVCALVLQGMMKTGGHWLILGLILIAEEPDEGADGSSLKLIVDKAREHLMHFDNGGAGPVVGYGATGVDFDKAVKLGANNPDVPSMFVGWSNNSFQLVLQRGVEESGIEGHLVRFKGTHTTDGVLGSPKIV